MRRIVSFIILLCILCGCAPQKRWAERYDKGDESNVVIAYVPLDDRPINTTRATLLSESAGVRLSMPDKALYRTALDNQPNNPNGTQYGDGEAILDWLEGCKSDYYVISVDQILSGGLVNSRHKADISNEFKQIDRLFSILEGKSAVLFDTVMRLSPTVGYNGCTLEEYNQLRNYGMLPREEILGELTSDGVISKYEVETDVDGALVATHLSVRERKIKLSEYLLKKLSTKPNIRIFYGIDDSHVGNTIQTNEIALIKQNLYGGEIFAGTDELGLMALSYAIKLEYKGFSSPSVGICYYGVDSTLPSDEYDIGSLEENLSAHISALDLLINNENPDIELLVYGGGAVEADKLLARYEENLRRRRPTAMIDVDRNFILPKKILSEKTELTCLLYYSSWNTVGNSIGIALSNTLSRYLYLLQGKPVEGASSAFVKSLALSFAKDVSYSVVKSEIDEYVVSCGGDVGNFFVDGINADLLFEKSLSAVKDGSELSFSKFSELFQNNQFLTSLVPYGLGKMPALDLVAVHFPWFRTFEAELDLAIAE